MSLKAGAFHTYAECGLRHTPSLGPGTFLFYVALQAKGVRIAYCNVVIKDLGGGPLEITAQAGTGGTSKYTGTTSTQILCGWATGIAELMMRPAG